MSDSLEIINEYKEQILPSPKIVLIKGAYKT